MKTPRFWYPPHNDLAASMLSGLLSPFSYMFKAGTSLRRSFSHPYHSHKPVVCVGNVVAGGAGKTPTALALARILKSKGHRPVFVTRGYGGHEKLVCVDPIQHNADHVGDEALLLATSGPTWVSSNRPAAVRQAENNGTVIIMDDGLQNPTIKPTTGILVIDGEVGIGNGRIIPAGPLRESFADALNRVSAVIIIGDKDRQNLATKIEKKPVFRARLQPILSASFPRNSKFVAFAGIARPQKFYTTARALGLDIVATQDFPDHHPFTLADLDSLRLTAEEHGALLLTTEKDAVRLPPDFRNDVVILPVTLVFDDPDAEARLARLCFT